MLTKKVATPNFPSVKAKGKSALRCFIKRYIAMTANEKRKRAMFAGLTLDMEKGTIEASAKAIIPKFAVFLSCLQAALMLTVKSARIRGRKA